MIFFICWLIFCDKEGIVGIFITMNDNSLFLYARLIKRVVLWEHIRRSAAARASILFIV